MESKDICEQIINKLNGQYLAGNFIVNCSYVIHCFIVFELGYCIHLFDYFDFSDNNKDTITAIILVIIASLKKIKHKIIIITT